MDKASLKRLFLSNIFFPQKLLADATEKMWEITVGNWICIAFVIQVKLLKF